jgi:hypothetical protein
VASLSELKAALVLASMVVFSAAVRDGFSNRAADEDFRETYHTPAVRRRLLLVLAAVHSTMQLILDASKLASQSAVLSRDAGHVAVDP